MHMYMYICIHICIYLYVCTISFMFCEDVWGVEGFLLNRFELV